ncbi:transposase [Cryobacterium sp. TMT1-3]|nr:transposase [Cryobacterium sp. TMT1-3]
MRDWLPTNHLAWFLIDVVKQLDTSALHDKTKLGGTGRGGYNPDLLLAVWIYASARGISSSRQIERACIEDVAFRVLCGQDVPDHTVLARFRQRNRGAMAGLFAQVLVLCVSRGLGKFGVIAIDGTKIKANASKDQNRSLKKLRDLAKTILDQAAATDAAEDAANTPTADDDLPDGFEPGPDRATRIRAELDTIRAAIEPEPETDSATEDTTDAAVKQKDPPGPGGSRLERIQDGIAQLEAVVKAENDPLIEALQTRLLCAQERLSDLEAKQAASRARFAAKPNGYPPRENNGRWHKAVHGVAFAEANLARARERADRQLSGETESTGRYLLRRNITDPDSRLMHARDGFVQSYNAQLATADDQLIIAVDVVTAPNDQGQLIPMMANLETNLRRCQQETSRTDLDVGLVVADNGYLSNENVDAPGFDRLLAPGRGKMKDGAWAGTINAKSGEARSHAVNTMVTKLALPGNQKIYNRRGVLVEPVNAFLKDRRGLRQFACRGHAAAQAEVHFAALTTNLMKLFTAGLTAAPATS